MHNMYRTWNHGISVMGYRNHMESWDIGHGISVLNHGISAHGVHCACEVLQSINSRLI